MAGIAVAIIEGKDSSDSLDAKAVKTLKASFLASKITDFMKSPINKVENLFGKPIATIDEFIQGIGDVFSSSARAFQ